MIPILYAENETNFTSNGLGRLSDAVSCKVIEERNGQYTLEMVYPIDGQHYADIQESCFIYATPSDGASKQPFRIYQITKPLNGRVTIKAEHRSYQLKNIPCGAFTASDVSSALQGLKTNSLEPNPFTFWTDKSTSATYTQVTPAAIRERLGGVEGSILDVYGGEFEWDNLTVRLHASRGADRGVVLNYGKNITDINQEKNIENAVTGVVGFYYQGDTLVQTQPVYSENADLYPYKRTVPVDFTTEFDSVPTVDQLTAKATSYVSGLGAPSVSIKVSFVALWQTEEYKHIANLERVKLCDTVRVYFEKLGIEAQAKVIKTDYDVLKERYNTIEIGDARTTLSSQVVAMNKTIEESPSNSDMQRAISNATNLISGGLGGYVVLKKNASGKPEEILIMDNEDMTQAVNVIRMNKNGIGFSTTGYNGPFTTAWTIDGSFVADFITSGTLRAINIVGVNINNGSGTFTVDNTGALTAKNATLTSPVGTAKTTIDSGGMTMESQAGNNYVARVQWNGVYVDDGTDQTAIGAGILSMNKHSGGSLIGGSTISYGRIQTQEGSFTGNVYVSGNLQVQGTKSRVAETEDYGDRLLYCYETATPYFGDLGEGKTDDSGKCYIFLDDVLDETMEGKYQVFLQAYGDGKLFVSERTSSYFVVEGEPNTAFGWELKAPQKGYSLHRLEPFEAEEPTEDNTLEDLQQYINNYLYNVEGESA